MYHDVVTETTFQIKVRVLAALPVGDLLMLYITAVARVKGNLVVFGTARRIGKAAPRFHKRSSLNVRASVGSDSLTVMIGKRVVLGWVKKLLL